MPMLPLVKKFKKELIKAGFFYNPNDDTFIRVKPFTGLSTKLYFYNTEINMSTGTLNSKWWEHDFNIQNYNFKPDVELKDILEKCLDV